LIDSNHGLAEGQVVDMNRGLFFVPPVHIHAGEYPDCKWADVIVKTDLDHNERNELNQSAEVMRNICRGVL
jgi:malate/lactate dehydrogenase